jgi:phosphatidylinositol glycan class B
MQGYQVMSMPCVAIEPSDSRPRVLTNPRLYPLVVILLLAAALRLPLAFWPNVHHPDEIFQYLEPAWRMLGHESIITWEWRYGMRSWLLPSIMVGPVAIGDWIAPGGIGAFVLPRILVAAASLSIVASAWAFGARVSRTHSILAGFVAAIWFEFVYFAPHTLSEPLATAAVLPAAWLLTRNAPSSRDLVLGGALAALAFLFRFQYAPAIAVLVLGACWHHWKRLPPLALGGAAILAVGGAIDVAHGAVPFSWLVANIEQNLLHDRAAEFGTEPAATYIALLWNRWSIVVVPLSFAIFRGYRHAPLLFWVALTDFAFHSLIAHKEPRFIFLSMSVLIIIAALGSADWVLYWSRFAWRRLAGLAIAGGWVAASAALAATGEWPEQWMHGIGAARLASELKADPQMCGLALYDVYVFQLAGRDRLAGDTPLFAFYARDPLAGVQLSDVTRDASRAFNRILAPRSVEKELPANFTARDCDSVGGAQVCIFVRDGTCDTAAASSFAPNDVLKRMNL